MATVFAQVLGLFIFVSIGYALGKFRVCDFSHTKVLSIEELQDLTGISKAVVEILQANGVLNGLSQTSQLSFF